MKLLIVNPIIYTSETRNIKKVDSIKDTMSYDLCLGFLAAGHEVVLAAGEDYKPCGNESYPFEIIWLKTKLKKVFPANTIPFCPEVVSLAKNGGFDLIITSEVFSLNSLMLTLSCRKKLIVWHELAKHNKLMHQIPSKIWYNIIAKLFFRKVLVVPRSVEAKSFISQFCKNVSDTIIDHGVNLDKFTACEEKNNIFCVSSQLIPRKRINKIIDVFVDYLKSYDSTAKLYIMGEGDEEQALKAQAADSGYGDSIIFTGKLAHSELIEYLKKAKALLIYTEKDNNMVSVVESIAVATPIVTTSVPYNSTYVRENELGIVDDNWNAQSLKKISDNEQYIKNCLEYRNTLSTLKKADTFIETAKSL